MQLVVEGGRVRPDHAERGAGGVDALARVLFVAAIVALAFGYGYVARSWKLFPYAQMQQAGDAVSAAVKYYADADYLEVPTDRRRAGVTVLDESRAAPGLTFLGLYTGERFSARLVDLRGNLIHEWRVGFREVWGERPPHVQMAADDSIIEWHGTHLYPNGDLLLNFEGHLFPYGGGLVRLDKDSRVVWKLARNTHHSVEVAEDGTIWVPAMNYRPDGMPELPGFESWFYEDTILKVSPDGEVLDEISVPLALRSLPGLLPSKYDGFDPTHVNDVAVLPAALQAGYPMLAAGELIVSVRNLNAIVAIDPTRKAATWSLVGPFRRQHDPDLLPNGHVLVFDNLGGDPACGRTRILELDPVSDAVAWQYDGCGGDRLDSEAKGVQQALSNGNVLITESYGGRVLEVTRDSRPRIVWEYVNLIGEKGGQRIAGVINHARRFAPGELTFLEDLHLLASRAGAAAEPVREAHAIDTGHAAGRANF